MKTKPQRRQGRPQPHDHLLQEQEHRMNRQVRLRAGRARAFRLAERLQAKLE